MTENLAQYLASALRIGVERRSMPNHLDKRSSVENGSVESNQNQFLLDARLSLRLDEIA